MKLIPSLTIAALMPLCMANALNKKQWTSWQSSTVWWTPSPTQYWAPTASYQSIWTGTSTSTVYMYITQPANVVVTMTSYIPCVVTSTTWVYQCQGGCPTTQVQQGPQQGGTVTVTSYAEVTGSAQVTTRTVTSGSYVLAIIEAATASGGTVSNVAGSMASINAPVSPVLPIMFAISVFWLMIWL